MKEQPILFKAETVRAILEGRKTQTRRIIKSQSTTSEIYQRPDELWIYTINGVGVGLPFKCPYGQIGDRLWVRETWAPSYHGEDCIYRADPDDEIFKFTGKWKPSIFMPRWASRINLEITNVRAERLQDITEEAAQAEGCESRDSFKSIWDSINGGRSFGWDSNPWVWVIEFKKI
jgi:hypothetical protein